MSVRNHLRGATALLLSVLWLTTAYAAQTTGVVVGSVNNAASSAILEGARVEILSLGVSALTDGAGRFTIIDVPAGTYQMEASYTGLDPLRKEVVVEAGGRVTVSFDLRSDVYVLNAFHVTSEREGNAASITRQRNAPNVKNVVALDAFGTLSNDNAGELLVRLPGVGGRIDDEGNITGALIRGTAAGLNTVSVDGNLQASTGGMGRDFRTHAISGALFDEIEVTKAPTPDMPAESLGGAVNFKTRSPLDIKERHQTSYRASVRWAPPFLDNVPLRENHRAHPLVNFNYQGLFDVFGDTRNLGVSVSAFYSENVNSYKKMIQDYQYTTSSPAYTWDYRNADGYNNRKQTSSNLKFAYRLNEHTELYYNMIVNDAYEPYNDIYTSRAYSGRTVGTSGTSAILPTYTDDVTQVRPVSSANFQLNSTRYSFITRERLFNIGGKSNYDRWKFDYDLNYNFSHPNLGDGRRPATSGGIFTMNIASLGWILDKSQSRLFPSFTQTAGSPIDDIASYKNGLLTTRDGSKRNTDILNASANASYILPVTFKSVLKTGVRFRHEKFDVVGASRQWNFVGSSLASLVDPSIVTSSEQYYGYDLPFVSSVMAAQSIRDNPELWKENLYYAASSKLEDTSSVSEDVSAAYVQSQSSFGRLGVLTGVRFERADVRSFGYLPSKTLSTSAQQAADPVGAANADYNNPETLKGHYQDFFPGVHLNYKIMRNFLARASYSQGIGRPAASSLTPSLSYSDTAQTVTVNNPALKPQYSKNYDLSLEYYFEPVGQFSVGYFRKELTDFLTTATIGTVGSGSDNGYNGDFEGYSIISNINAGSATIDGWELSYTQQFTFLPGFLKGFGAFANYTKLKTKGDYGDATARSSNKLAGFIPETANAGLTYKYRRFGSRIMLNYTGDYLNNYSSDAWRLQYRAARTTVNLGLSYEVNRYCSLSCDVSNLFNEPQILYRYSKDRTSAATWNFTAITFGVSGRF